MGHVVLEINLNWLEHVAWKARDKSLWHQKSQMAFHYSRAWVGQNNTINSQEVGRINGLPMLINGIYTVHRNDIMCSFSSFPTLLFSFTYIFIGFPGGACVCI